MTSRFVKGGWLAGWLLGIPALALAAGLLTNGLPTVGPGTANGVAATAPNGVVSWLAANGKAGVTNPLIPVDTGLTGGAAPQEVAVSPFQIAATLVEASQNTATSTVHAATLNTLGGTITTESLTTVPGGTYTFTLTNSLISTSVAAPQVAMFAKSSPVSGPMAVTSVTNAAGSTVIVFTNVGTTALNGTMMIVFHL